MATVSEIEKAYEDSKKYNLYVIYYADPLLNQALHDAYGRYKFIVSQYSSDRKNNLGSVDKIDNVIIKGRVALKRLYKFAKYVDKLPNKEEKQQKIATIFKLIRHMNEFEYDKIISVYDQEFSASDWERLNQAIVEDPTANYFGSEQGLMYSYIINDINGEIVRRGDTLGSGGYGRTKQGITNPINVSSAIKRQKPKASKDPQKWLADVAREAIINLDLNVATSNLLKKFDSRGDVVKVYQLMHDLGKPLSKYLKDDSTGSDKRLDYAIDLLLKVNDLHLGKTSNSGKKYAHRDIKPDNITVDASGDLHLIDFTFTKDDDLEVLHQTKQGTREYKPISFDLRDRNDAICKLNKNACVTETTPSYFFDDKIAALRTIHHPLSDNIGIIKQEDFNQLPQVIANILDTSNIQKCIALDKLHTLSAIASVLIFYKTNPSEWTVQKVQSLLSNTQEQNQLIATYQQDKILARNKQNNASNTLAREGGSHSESLDDVFNELMKDCTAFYSGYHSFFELKCFLNETAEPDQDQAPQLKILHDQALRLIVTSEKSTNPTKKDNYLQAAKAAICCYRLLSNRVSLLKKGDISNSDFYHLVTHAVLPYMPTLESHRGIKQNIYDILNAVLFIPGLIKYTFFTGKFRFLKAETKTSGMVKDMINKNKPTT